MSTTKPEPKPARRPTFAPSDEVLNLDTGEITETPKPERAPRTPGFVAGIMLGWGLTVVTGIGVWFLTVAALGLGAA